MHLLSFASLLSCFFVFVFVSLFLHVYFIQIQRRAGAHPISQLYHALARHGHSDVINARRPKYAKSLPRKVPGKQQLSIGECSYANCRRAHFIVLPHTCCSCTFTTLPRISWFLLDISNFIHSSGVWGANYFEILALPNLTPQFCHSGGGFDDKKYVNGTHNKQQYYCNSPYFGGNVQKGGLLNEIGMIAPLSDLPIW